MIQIRLEFETDLENAVVAGATVRAFCKSVGFDATANRDVELCVVEAVTNAVVHAYPSDQRGWIGVYAEWTEVEIKIWVVDRGRTIEPAVRDRHLQMTETDTAQLVEGGRGLFLMASLMDGLQFSSNGGLGNVVFMRKTPTDRRLAVDSHGADSQTLDTPPLWVDEVEEPPRGARLREDDARQRLRRR